MKSQMLSLVNSTYAHFLRSQSRLSGRAFSRSITTKSKTRGPASPLVQRLVKMQVNAFAFLSVSLISEESVNNEGITKQVVMND